MTEQGSVIEEIVQNIDLSPVVDYLAGVTFGFVGVLFAWRSNDKDGGPKYPMCFGLVTAVLLWRAPIHTPAFTSGYIAFPLITGLGVVWWHVAWHAGWINTRNATLEWLAKTILPIAPLLIARAFNGA